MVSSSGGIVSHDNPKPPRCILTISGGRRTQGIKEGLKSSTDTASRTRALLRFLQPTQERKTADTNPVGAFGVAAYRRTETWAGFWNVDEAECDLTKVTI